MGRGAENGGAENSRISSGMGTWPLPPADSTMMLHPPRRARVGHPRFLPGGGVFRGAERGGGVGTRGFFLPFGPTNPSPPRPPTPTFGVNSQGQEEGTREHSTPGGAPHGRKLWSSLERGGIGWSLLGQIYQNTGKPLGTLRGGGPPNALLSGSPTFKKKTSDPPSSIETPAHPPRSPVWPGYSPINWWRPQSCWETAR